MKNNFIKASLFVILSLFSQVGSAYSIDTHFYETYAAARWVGIGHETALELATHVQWIDVQLSSSAMFPTWVIGSRLRRVFHFPTNKVEYKTGVETNHGQHMKIYGLTTINHPFASEMLTEGLRTGSIFLSGGGIHTLQDSAAHSGNGYSIGHALLGHWPDRPWAFIEKHNEMRKFFFKALIAIRKSLPEEALDKSLDTGNGLNYLKNAEELCESFINNSVIKKVTESNPMRDPRFVRPTLEEIIRSARAQNLITDALDAKWIEKTFPGIFEKGNDAREIVEKVFNYLVEQPEQEKLKLVNLTKVYAEVLPELPVGKEFAGVKITRERFAQQLGADANKIIVKELTRLVTWSIVPEEPFKDAKGNYSDNGYTPKAAFEHEGQYEREEAIKVNDWQDSIQKLYGGNKIVFAGSNWFIKLGKMFAKSKGTPEIFQSMERLDVIQMKFDNRVKYYWATFKFAILDWFYYLATNKLVDLKIMKQPKGKARNVADPANMLYQMEDVFDQLKENGFYKNVLTDKQFQEIKEDHRKRIAKETQRLKKLGFEVGPQVFSCSKLYSN